MTKRGKLAVAVVIVAVILAFVTFVLGPFYTLSETEVAVVTQFGKVQRIVTDAGFHWKTPMVDQVNKLEKRILDLRVIPICVDHIIDTGFFRKRIVYYHNYGDHIQITILMLPMVGKPKIIKYNYSTKTKHRKSSQRKVKRQSSKSDHYVV